jgi:xanthine dehydrogenase YagR molybdenum-binding subunit
VPVNLDIGSIEAHFVDERDPHVNAVYHATGRRVRELPIRIEALL